MSSTDTQRTFSLPPTLIVGNLGYKQDRGDVTPVYRLQPDTLTIHKVEDVIEITDKIRPACGS
jgi:hypothetical protein